MKLPSKLVPPLTQQSCILALTRSLCTCASSGSGRSGDGKDSGTNKGCGHGEQNTDSATCTQSNEEKAANNPSGPVLYDNRKYGHYLPQNNVKPRFETLPNVPTGVFRCTEGEILGPKADKCSYYLNPEYFSFHHMSYYDLHLALSCNRKQRPDTGRKP